MFITKKIKDNPKFINSIVIIFLIYFSIYLLFNLRILPSFSLTIYNITLPSFQTTQILFVFPLILFISYILFIRKGIIKWQDLGFNRGKNGLLNTIFLGLLGGLAIGVYNYLLMDYFILQNQVAANFIEKCLFAPIWEEFFNRVLFLVIIETAIIITVNKYYFENPKYKDKISEKSRKFDLFGFYLLILFIGGIWFVWWHGIWQSGNILFAGMIAGAVYLKTRSIIAPIIVHSLSNFVTGGFLILIIHNLCS
jgi:hypothetical protein